ncbi:hypothetical protein VIGAN_02035600 [Vigna angularis var. angularis]|uniref:Uncharacterized protein n=1 Tax=Vigna angularis var. angularis TaxID=157739 RepID=A0A0S3RB85_PHAAN|nr:hypothetical protein VIGAN_02035600 [Vigna angularis var. angularis]
MFRRLSLLVPLQVRKSPLVHLREKNHRPHLHPPPRHHLHIQEKKHKASEHTNINCTCLRGNLQLHSAKVVASSESQIPHSPGEENNQLIFRIFPPRRWPHVATDLGRQGHEPQEHPQNVYSLLVSTPSMEYCVCECVRKSEVRREQEKSVCR